MPMGIKSNAFGNGAVRFNFELSNLCPQAYFANYLLQGVRFRISHELMYAQWHKSKESSVTRIDPQNDIKNDPCSRGFATGYARGHIYEQWAYTQVMNLRYWTDSDSVSCG